MQSAYRPVHSTETALLKIHNDMLLSVDNGDEVVLLLLDLSAAFDTIDHSLLLKRLRSRYGITDLALKWLSSYIQGRKQSVIIGDSSSSTADMNCGIPQGSVLGPILFAMYTASLGDIIRAHGVKYMFYADDTQLYISVAPRNHREAATKIEACVNDVRHWMILNKLQINDSKTEMLHVTSKHRASEPFHQLSVGKELITPVQKIRNLGVFMDSNLSMLTQIKTITKTASYNIWKIGKLRQFLDKKCTESLIHAFVTSRIDFCNSLYIGLPSKLINKLQQIQNTAARVVTRTRKFEPITPIRQALHWLPVKERIEFKMLLLCYKALNNQAPCYLANMLQPYVPSRKLRSSSGGLLVYTKSSHTNLRRSGFCGSSSTAVELSAATHQEL